MESSPTCWPCCTIVKVPHNLAVVSVISVAGLVETLNRRTVGVLVGVGVNLGVAVRLGVVVTLGDAVRTAVGVRLGVAVITGVVVTIGVTVTSGVGVLATVGVGVYGTILQYLPASASKNEAL